MYREETEDSDIDDDVVDQIKLKFDNYQRKLEVYNNFLKNPPRDKRAFVELRQSIDAQMIEE